MIRIKDSIYNKKLVYCLLAALLLLSASFIVMVTSYFQRFDQKLAKENEIRLSETAGQIRSHTLTIVQDTKTLLRTSADALSSIQGDDNKISYLSSVGKKPGIVFIGYAGRDGRLKTPNLKKPEDISKEAYFRKACAGKTEVTNLQRKILQDKAVSGILFSVPVYNKSKGVKGTLIAMMDIKKLQEALNINSFNGNGYAYLIDAHGELILRTKSMDYNNYFTVLQSVSFSDGYSLKKTKADINNNRKGMTLYDHLGTDQYAYYQPLGFNGWTIINIVAKDAVSANTAALTKELSAFSIVCVTVFMLLLASVVVSLVISKNQRHIAEMKSAFLANMSHEIRTPMNAVRGVSELLLREKLTEKQREYVETIDHSSRSLLSIINDILDFSKIESGKFTLSEEEYSLRRLVMDVTALTVIRIGNKPVRFYVDLEDQLPARLYGDAARIKQIMINLLGNAVKFTDRGHICLRIQTAMKGEDCQLIITVEDTGIGIKKQDVSRLFNSFEQVDTHHSHSNGGTGLGLAISKNLAGMMKGSIQVESTYGEGSAFTAVVCQKSVGDESLFRISWSQGASLAVYEPDRELRSFYQKILEKYHIYYKIYSDQTEFIDRAAQGKFQYILADKESLIRLSALDENPPYTCAVLHHQGEDSGIAGILAVSSSLFQFGLEDLIHSENKDIPLASGQFDISMIRPIPEAKILLVDDNRINLGVAEALMAPYQMQIDCVLSGKDAVQSVKKNNYDLIFLDHMMPEMDGIETLKAIRSLKETEKNKIPIIALTANVTREAQEMFRREGFDGFMPKPVDIELLDELLNKFLREP